MNTFQILMNINIYWLLLSDKELCFATLNFTKLKTVSFLIGWVSILIMLLAVFMIVLAVCCSYIAGKLLLISKMVFFAYFCII